MNSDIYNVYPIESNTDLQDWVEMSPCWLRLGKDIGVTSEFSALTLKSFYVTGLVITICNSVTILLSTGNLISTTYYPAYGVFASTVELLGRCLRGNDTNKNSTQDLTEGFKWLANPNAKLYKSLQENHILVSTINYTYSIKELVDLRHFAAHGQGMNQAKHQDITGKTDRLKIKDFDYLILAEMPPLIGNAMQAYLHELTFNETLAKSLAKASVTPYRNRPILDVLLSYQTTMGSFPERVGHVLSNFDWTYKSPIDLDENAT